MGKYIISEGTLRGIADAIREKTGSADKLTPTEMVEAIAGLSIGTAVTGPYIEYTLDAQGNVIEASLHGMTSVPPYTFYRHTKLINVDFSDSPNLTSIGMYAFYGCTSLALTSLPDCLVSISDRAFYGCTSLALTALPESLTSIGEYGFRECASLALTSLHENLSIGDAAFYKCTSLTNMEIKCAKLGSSQMELGYCTGLQKVWIRNTCDAIPTTYPNSTPFYGCSKNLTIYAEDAAKQTGWGTYFNYVGTGSADKVTVKYGQTECPW